MTCQIFKFCESVIVMNLTRTLFVHLLNGTMSEENLSPSEESSRQKNPHLQWKNQVGVNLWLLGSTWSINNSEYSMYIYYFPNLEGDSGIVILLGTAVDPMIFRFQNWPISVS